ncbi:hypothetical protein GIB67_026802 [Kingdonia uniflora]|uniref:Uncharacterized protein n=1 Tax=Kingdonia uniflora TaxID=39325 RepID=A0A7J7MHH7_9MAGN|nr:hypothetical protein GIB67_026802 [Kingdonia uniflora]
MQSQMPTNGVVTSTGGVIGEVGGAKGKSTTPVISERELELPQNPQEFVGGERETNHVQGTRSDIQQTKWHEAGHWRHEAGTTIVSTPTMTVTPTTEPPVITRAWGATPAMIDVIPVSPKYFDNSTTNNPTICSRSSTNSSAIFKSRPVQDGNYWGDNGEHGGYADRYKPPFERRGKGRGVQLNNFALRTRYDGFQSDYEIVGRRFQTQSQGDQMANALVYALWAVAQEVKLNIVEFGSKVDADADADTFMDWLNQVDKILAYKRYGDLKTVVLIETKLTDYALN